MVIVRLAFSKGIRLHGSGSVAMVSTSISSHSNVVQYELCQLSDCPISIGKRNSYLFSVVMAVTNVSNALLLVAWSKAGWWKGIRMKAG